MFVINTFIALVGVVYEHFLKESNDLFWKNTPNPNKVGPLEVSLSRALAHAWASPKLGPWIGPNLGPIQP